MKRMARWVACLCAAMLVASCGDDDPPDGQNPATDAARADVAPDRADGTTTDAATADTENAPDAVADRAEADADARPDASLDRSVPDTAVDSQPDTTPDASDAADASDGAPPCALMACNGLCVDPQVDPQNCGTCGNACTGSDVCSRGACRPTCPAGFVACGRSCVDPQTSRTHCGASASCESEAGTAGTACSGGQVCNAGTCQLSCQSGLINCQGTCINPNLNPLFCGATAGCGAGSGSAGMACTAGQVCSNGQCQLSCQAGLINCGGFCVNPQTDNSYCGASGTCGTGDAGNAGTACAAGQVCSNGSCALTCQTGLVNCSGECVNPASDRLHCGASGNCQGTNAGVACAPGRVCTTGTCQLSCQAGLVNCDSVCIDPQDDRAFCGATGDCQGANRGTACAAGQVCNNATCGLSCQNGLINCNGKCIDPLSDPANCGATADCQGANDGDICPAGHVCNAGACSLSCQSGLINCAGVCINPQTSPVHCGATGNCQGSNAGTACAAGQVCTAGACSLSCQAGLVNCAGVCVNPSTDRTHCGAVGDCLGPNAGATCAMGRVCSAGTCELSCQAGLVNCGGECINPNNSLEHCGASGDCLGPNAGTACNAGQVCSGGGCSLTCQSGLLNCGGKCIDPLTDNTHCGATTDCQAANAGVACAPGQVCNAGACTLTCQAGLLNCNGTCINPASDLVHCGATGDCQAGNAGATCLAGQICNLGVCQLSCQVGLVNCNGTCINPTSDNTYCGASGNCTAGTAGTTCAAGQVCNGGTCGLTCQAGLVNCNGTCVNPATDDAHCGATGDCQGANAGVVCPAGQVCSGGSCALSCQAGLVNCNGTCIDPSTDRTYCGAIGNCQGAANDGTTCAAGEVCNSGTCQLSCQAGLVNCGGTCINPTTDNGHCGALSDCLGPNAGTVCAAGRVCVGGSCQLSCQTGLINCASTCVDPLTDRAFCGATGDCAGPNAGNICAAGQVCNGGTCQLSCQPGLVNCNGTCIDPDTDRDHCGASGTCQGGSAGTVCQSGQVCSTGSCQVSCPAGQVNCGGTCIVPGTDRDHCGASGNCQGPNAGAVCAAGQVCTSGVCQVSCPGGQINCGGSCVNPSNDLNHCGATGDCQGGNSGNVCAAGQVCSLGTCQVNCGGGLTNCGGTCTSTSTDPQNCNTCGNACPGRTNAASACAGSNCGFVCNSNFGDCDASRANGCESNLLTDANNCGSCGAVCPPGVPCNGGSCGCALVTNDGNININNNTWFDNCVAAAGNTVSLMLLDGSNNVVYQATGTKVGTWTSNNITADNPLNNQWNPATHNRAIILDNGDKLTIAGKNSSNSGCGGSLGNGYGIVISSPGSGGNYQAIRLLVMGYNHGFTNTSTPRFLAGWSQSTEISYNGGAIMNSCSLLTGFSGTFVFAVAP